MIAHHLHKAMELQKSLENLGFDVGTSQKNVLWQCIRVMTLDADRAEEIVRVEVALQPLWFKRGKGYTSGQQRSPSEVVEKILASSLEHPQGEIPSASNERVMWSNFSIPLYKSFKYRKDNDFL